MRPMGDFPVWRVVAPAGGFQSHLATCNSTLHRIVTYYSTVTAPAGDYSTDRTHSRDRFLFPSNPRTREHPNHCFLPTFTTLYAEPTASLVYCCYSDHVLHVFASFSKIRVYIFHFVFAYLLCIILYLCFWVCGTLFYGFYSDHALEKLRRGV